MPLPKYVIDQGVQGLDGAGIYRSVTWPDIEQYLQSDPRPFYRLVSATLEEGVPRIIWERLT